MDEQLKHVCPNCGADMLRPGPLERAVEDLTAGIMLSKSATFTPSDAHAIDLLRAASVANEVIAKAATGNGIAVGYVHGLLVLTCDDGTVLWDNKKDNLETLTVANVLLRYLHHEAMKEDETC